MKSRRHWNSGNVRSRMCIFIMYISDILFLDSTSKYIVSEETVAITLTVTVTVRVHPTPMPHFTAVCFSVKEISNT